MGCTLLAGDRDALPRGKHGAGVQEVQGWGAQCHTYAGECVMCSQLHVPLFPAHVQCQH